MVINLRYRRYYSPFLLLAGIAAVVGVYYWWAVRATGHPFIWGHELNGYYNYLARGLARGQLHVPIAPRPELLAAPDPWDPTANDEYKMHDMALYHGRYYLYHGVGPAVLLFVPWRLITGTDLPENFALFVLCFGGFFFASGALLRALHLAGATPGPLLLGALVLALGFCQSAPYLLNRVWVYEIAIGGGYFATSGAIFFFLRAIDSRRAVWWMAAAGAMAGLAIACRPHLGLVGLMLLLVLVVLRAAGGARSREVGAFVVPLAIAGIALAAYNYLRFDSPFEPGIRYLLSGPNQNRIRLASANLLPGLYYFLACAPEFGPVFPWVRIATRSPFDSPGYPLPTEYFLEGVTGALYLAPFVVAALFVPRNLKMPLRLLLWSLLAAAAGILVFLSLTGFTTHRYEVDFLPILVWVAAVNLGIRVYRDAIWKRAAAVVAIGFGIVVNLALGVTGPYDEMLRERPAGYLRIAGWFSPIERFRPVLNPEVDVRFAANPTPHDAGFREPLLSMGHGVYRYFLILEHQPGGRMRFVSRQGSSTQTADLEMASGRSIEFRLVYMPANGRVAISADGREVLVHPIGRLVTAPSEIRIGEAPRDDSLTVTRFTGPIQLIPSPKQPRSYLPPHSASSMREYSPDAYSSNRKFSTEIALCGRNSM